jgi:hypothetical protein
MISRGESRQDAFVGVDFVLVCALEIGICHFENGTRNQTRWVAIEFHDWVMRLATCPYDLWVFDLDYRLLELNEIIRMTDKKSSEGCELHAILLERAIREEKRHVEPRVSVRSKLRGLTSKVTGAPRGRSPSRSHESARPVD